MMLIGYLVLSLFLTSGTGIIPHLLLFPLSETYETALFPLSVRNVNIRRL